MKLTLFKGIRPDQTRARQRQAGRFYTPDLETARLYGDKIECRVVEFKRLHSTSNPLALAKIWKHGKTVNQLNKARCALPDKPKGALHNRWPPYHALFYELDKVIAKEARQRGYDGIHYSWWHTYVKL